MTTKEYYTALKAEITNDPKALGFNGESDQWIVDKLNELGASSETIVRTSVATKDILEALVFDEVNALTTKSLQILNLFSYTDSVDPSKQEVQNLFNGIFTAGTTTRSNLNTLAIRIVSRAEKIGFPVVELSHVENALHTTWWDV